MSETEGRFLIGAILVSFGTTYILNATNLVNSSFWLFVSLLLIMEGAYYSGKGFLTKTDVSFPLAVLFFGTAEMLFLFNLVYYSFSTFLAAVFVSIGLGLLVSGLAIKYSTKKFVSGILVTLFGIIISIPALFNITGKLDRFVRIYGIGTLLIILGILVIFPPKKGDVKK